MNCRPCRAGTLLYLLVFIAPSIGAGAGNSTARPESVPSDWFHVIQLDESTYAVSEPKYWLKNVSYLLIGSRSSLLFDTGPGVHSIRPVVDRLTHVPVLVLPSHLHFDHVGRIEEFSHVALVSTAALRTETRLVTRSLQIFYHRPVPVERPLEVVAWIDAHTGRHWEVSARMALAADSRPLATARAELRTRRPDHFARHQAGLAHN